MTSEEIYAILQPIIATYLPEDVSAEYINKDADLTQELNINSAHLVAVVLDVEDAFGIELSNNDLETLRTVNDAIAIVENKVNN